MTNVAVGAVGFLIGLASHDIALQALGDGSSLRPFIGVCAQCGRPRGWLSPRCPHCRRLIGREPVVAAVTAAAAIGFGFTIGASWELVPYLSFLFVSTALIITDLEAFRIVDRLNLPGTVVLVVMLSLAAVVSDNVDSLWRGLAGAAAYFAGSSILFLAVRGRGFGAGDVKLSAQLGLFTAYLSWGTLGWAVFATAAIGGVVALFMLVAGGAGMRTELPYGPPMILGAWTAIVMVGVGAIPVPT